MSTDPKETTHSTIHFGTLGLDAMLDYEGENWLTETPTEKTRGNLTLNSTTLLIGPAGSGKSGIGLQFLFQFWKEEHKWFSSENPSEPVLVAFDYSASDVTGTITRLWEKWRKIDASLKDIKKPVKQLLFRQAHIDPNLVVAQVRQSILGDGKNMPTRLMLDGLSEWLSSFEGSHREQVLEALLNGIFDARNERNTDGAKLPLTLMVSYEVEKADPLEVPATFGIPAENIFVLQPKQLQDTTRRLIYVAKAAGMKHDRSVREVRRNSENGDLRVVASLDEFKRVLSHKEEKADVSLQFFAENDSEHTWNKWAIEHLKGVYPLEYKLMRFDRSENSRTFEHSGGMGDSPELRLISVDEWWIHSQIEKNKTNGATKEESGQKLPMLKLTNLWSGNSPTHQGLEGSWSDYWYFEVEKAIPKGNDNSATKEMYAVPAYMDFSMFCVNLERVAECPKTGSEKWGTVLGLPPLAKPPQRMAIIKRERGSSQRPLDAINEPMRLKPKEIRAQRDTWRNLLDMFPRTWVPSPLTDEEKSKLQTRLAETQDAAEKLMIQNRLDHPNGWVAGEDFFTSMTEVKDWKLAPSAVGSLLELLPFRKRGDREKPALFAVDTSTPETLTCVWFELAWAFGAWSEFLEVRKRGGTVLSIDDLEKLPETQALVFLQELVLRGLMPARATIEKTSEALFSRQWGSTITYLKRNSNCEDTLVALPFWPVRSDDAETWVYSLCEAAARFARTMERLKIALDAVTNDKSCEALLNWKKTIDSKINKIRSGIKQLDPAWESQSKVARQGRCWNTIQASAQSLVDLLVEETKIFQTHLDSPELKRLLQTPSPAAQRKNNAPSHFPDYRDMVEIFQSHTLRMRMLFGALLDNQATDDEKIKADGAASATSEGGTTVDDKRRAGGGHFSSVLRRWSGGPYDLGIPNNWKLPSEAELNRKGEAGRTFTRTLAGHSTSGSWLYSVHNRSLGLSLAKPLLEELTSLYAAERRSRLGAGLPSRKDFYATSGDEYVPYCANLTWSELLRFAGARCRKRTQVVAGDDDILARFHLIAERLLDCLQRAYDDRPDDMSGMGGKLQKAKKRAAEFVQEILESLPQSK